MRTLTTIFATILFLLFSQQAFAEDSDDGPVLIGEFVYLDLNEDDLYITRGIVAYTLEVGLQFGAQVSTYYLDRPSVVGKDYALYCRVPDPTQGPIILDDEFFFWGVGPMAGFDLELVDGWFGFEFLFTPSFPITDDSSGWSIEAGVDAYFSFEGMSDDSFDFALMFGAKYGHYDIDADYYVILHDRVMPTFGIMGQF
jgi:hypothetical protein